MSNAYFPSPAVQQWGITWPIKKSPGFKTLVQTPANNRGEVRISLTQYPIWVWDLDVDYLKGDMSAAEDGSALQTVLGFFGQQQGAASDWLYQDPYDNSCVGEVLGVGDGTTQQFQTVRNTGGMVDLMQTVLPTTVYLNGTPIAAGPQTSGAQWYCGIENLLLSSQAFNNANWLATSTTPTNNSTTAPDGTSTGSTLAFSSHGASTFVGMIQNVSVPTTLPASVTVSVWIKTATGTASVELAIMQEGTNNAAVTTCAVTTAWTRFSATLTAAQQLGTSIQVQIRSPFTPSESGFSVFAWGAQLERWPSATGYNVTTMAASIPQGIITFASAPAAGVVVTEDFSFWYRCRFLDDQWTDLEEGLYRIWNLHTLKFKSLLL